MKKTFFAVAIITTLCGCSKVDKNMCWSQETKDSIDALIAAEAVDTKSRIQNFFEFKRIDVYFGSIDVNMKKSDFTLEKIDSETETVDCSFALNVEAKFNGGAALNGSGRVRFSSKNGEHGRYLTLSKADIPLVIANLK